MISTRTSRTVALFGLLAAAAGWLAFASGRPGAAGQPQATPRKAAAPEDRQPDQGAVRKALDGFVAAFRQGDAKAVAAHWTAEGEYTSDDGTTFRGRPALEKAYADAFAKSPGNKLEVEVDTVRFPSRDTAVVEGHFKLRKAKTGDQYPDETDKDPASTRQYKIAADMIGLLGHAGSVLVVASTRDPDRSAATGVRCPTRR